MAMELPCLSGQRRTKSPEVCLNTALRHVRVWFIAILRYAFVIALFWLLAACGGEGDDASGSTATDTMLALSWLPTSDVSGYIIYYGPTEDTATTVASTLPIESGHFNPSSPSIEYNAGFDLGLDHGASVCFRIRSYNDTGISVFSGPVCGSI